MTESPLINTLKSLFILGVEWTIEEVISTMFSFIRAAKVLERLVISEDTLNSPDFIAAVTETEESEKIFSVLCQKIEFSR